jgi:hypothetical protein
VLTVVAVLAVVFGIGGYLARQKLGDGLTLPPIIGAPECVVRADGEVRLDPEQMANAATIAAVGIRRGVPDRAVTVALATALQESKLHNLKHLGGGNDHDSVGLFQQRPSQGWGTEAQILDPRYASAHFYSALTRIKGWEKLRITEAAQRVQRSAYPEAYDKWVNEATVLARALTGQVAGSVSCDSSPSADKTGGESAARVAELMRLDFGTKAKSVVAKGNGVQLRVTNTRTGWQFAHWLVAQADAVGVTRVTFADQQWSANSGKWSPTPNVPEQVVAEVGDHV